LFANRKDKLGVAVPAVERAVLVGSSAHLARGGRCGLRVHLESIIVVISAVCGVFGIDFGLFRVVRGVTRGVVAVRAG